jgi:hypothetical protein
MSLLTFRKKSMSGICICVGILLPNIGSAHGDRTVLAESTQSVINYVTVKARYCVRILNAVNKSKYLLL